MFLSRVLLFLHVLKLLAYSHIYRKLLYFYRKPHTPQFTTATKHRNQTLPQAQIT